MSVVAAIDVGGMSIKRGVVTVAPPDGGVDLLAPVPIDATADVDELLGQFRDALDPVLDRVARASARDGVVAPVGVGVAFPGPMDYGRGVPYLQGQRKFEALHGVDLRSWMATTWAAMPLDARFVNDAEAAALGECVAGAGRGAVRSMTITLGTGFGAAAIVDGAAVSDFGGIEVAQLFATQIDDLGRADDVFSVVGLARLLGVAADDIPIAAERARLGDTELLGVFAAFGERLGRFLNAVSSEMDLDVVVVGGGGAHSFDLFGPTLAATSIVEARCAELGAHAALLGAALPWR